MNKLATLVAVLCLISIADSKNLIRMDMMRRNKNHYVTSEHMSTIHYPANSQNWVSRSIDTFMYGSINTTFEYYTAIELGKFQQTFTVQVDTGSSSLAVPATGCQEYNNNQQPTGSTCSHADAYYDMSSGSQVSCSDYPQCMCNGGECSFGLLYGDGSFLVGDLIQDKFDIAGLNANVIFGAITGESQSFARTEVDGIMGMAYGALFPSGGDSVFEKLVQNQQVENSFSMCLGYTGGILTLGGVDETYSAGPMQYTPIIQESYYVVSMEDLLVNNTSIGVPQSSYNTTIVDSGTTLLVLPQNAFNAMVNTFTTKVCPTLPERLQQVCTPDPQGNSLFTPGLCWNLVESEIALIPPISIKLKDIDTPLQITSDQYFLSVSGGYCFGVSSMAGLGTILGDVFMQGYNIEFDRANKRVGFAPVRNCSGAPATISKVSGDNQVGSYGFTLKEQLKVRVMYDNGLAAVGLIVQFSADGANFDEARVVTDPNGYAEVAVTVKKVGSIKVTATVWGTNTSVDFTVTGKALSVTGIILITLGSIAVAALIGGAVFLYIRKRRNQAVYRPLTQNDVILEDN